ncbi:MAG: hypothetical protein MMC33_000685 [Icmadophila ericetorum]|nr:hypothetical protein [Icmadophila ericetorum]
MILPRLRKRRQEQPARNTAGGRRDESPSPSSLSSPATPSQISSQPDSPRPDGDEASSSKDCLSITVDAMVFFSPLLSFLFAVVCCCCCCFHVVVAVAGAVDLELLILLLLLLLLPPSSILSISTKVSRRTSGKASRRTSSKACLRANPSALTFVASSERAAGETRNLHSNRPLLPSSFHRDTEMAAFAVAVVLGGGLAIAAIVIAATVDGDTEMPDAPATDAEGDVIMEDVEEEGDPDVAMPDVDEDGDVVMGGT